MATEVRYWCITEGKHIFEDRVDPYSDPTICKNSGHPIRIESITVIP